MTYTVIDTEPSERFPVYTRGNVGEVFPNVMTPMTGSLIGDASVEGQSRALRRLGLLVDADFAGSGFVGTGVFAGYLYGNLSTMRVACERMPGMSAADADRQVAGLSDDAPPHRRQPGDRNLRASLRGVRAVGRAILRPDISALDRAREATDSWRHSVPPASTQSDRELVDFIRAYPPRFADGMDRLVTYSGFAGAAGAMLEQLAERVDPSPGAAISMNAGLGTIDSAGPALLLWDMGRRVAASDTLTAFFDDGADPDALQALADDPDVASFRHHFADFVDRHGARGPDEWELASPTWGTDPTIALAAIDRLRHAPGDRDPHIAGERLAADRVVLSAEVRTRLPRPVRRLFDRVARAAALYAEGRERTKAVFIDDVYPVRCALFELGDRLADRGAIRQRSDVFFLTSDELPTAIADSTGLDAVIDERRARRDMLQERVPPFVFEGRIPDPTTWALRENGTSPTKEQKGSSGLVIAGQGVCPGTARGTARIVRDPAHPDGLEPGDILVAPLTDPAWTPLFLAAAGVVVEVGAQLSHASIVARELGIPAVVGAADATRLLADGQLIEVDGATGEVRIV